jgi:very-short-patch-repair endonuclease
MTAVVREARTLSIVSDPDDRMSAQLRRWQERLIDTSGRNPLLRFLTSRVARLQVTAPPSADVLKRLVDEETFALPLAKKLRGSVSEDETDAERWHVSPGDLEFGAADPQQLFRGTRKLYDNSRASLEERGVTTLHLAFGVLRWKDPRLGEDCSSPLLLVPCQLEVKGDRPFTLQKVDGELEVNPALISYLREEHGVSLPTISEEFNAEEYPTLLADFGRIATERGWEIRDEVWLATLSFEKLAIYRDLEALQGTARKHSVTRAFARLDVTAAQSESLPKELDSLGSSELPVPVLGADSSQLEALTYARRGAHVVIHGPPGTGKSQTIANLIADALGRGRTVLFVSAKMAALDVVYRRLEKTGLGRLCLEAHGVKSGKARITAELKRILDNDGAPEAAAFEKALACQVQHRDSLNAHVEALHRTREPLGRSLRNAIGRLEALREAPNVGIRLPWPDPLQVRGQVVEECIAALRKLATHEQLLSKREVHPWRGFTRNTRRLAAPVKNAVETVGEAIDEWKRLLAELTPVFAFKTPPSPQQLDRLKPVLETLCAGTALPSTWSDLDVGTLNEHAATADRLAALHRERTAVERALTGAGVTNAGRLVITVGDGLVRFSQWYRGLLPSYHRWKAGVRAALQPTAHFDRTSLSSSLRAARRKLEIDAKLSEHQRLATILLEGAPQSSDGFLTVSNRYRCASALRRDLEAVGAIITPSIGRPQRTVAQSSARLEHALVSKRADLAQAFALLAEAWPDGLETGQVASPVALPLDRLEARIAELQSSTRELHEWVALQEDLECVGRLGLTPLLVAMPRGTLSTAADAFERRFIDRWIDALLLTEPELARMSPGARQKLIDDFRVADDRLTQAARQSALSGGIVRLSPTADGECALLRREVQKKRNIKPLRAMFETMPRALQALKPCMLMSPMSVSSFLPPGRVQFDLVVFDEASQLPVAEAIPAILRARQVVVAGDEKQLPPTDFFRGLSGGEEDEDEGFEPLEALLDQCVVAEPLFRSAYLKWHYRSADARLIEFSNHHFYENRLVTFPSPWDKSADTGVHFELVDGVYDRGKSKTNRREARRVAQMIVEHWRSRPDESLGIVAMSSAQREAVEDALEDERREHPELGRDPREGSDEPLFIKSLENVQGDERDRIIISLGYARNPQGAMSTNFGPINHEHGWRRLNVLVTRARRQTVFVASVKSNDLGDIPHERVGARRLKDFMEYAATGALPGPSPVATHAETNDFEDAVQAVLEAAGHRVEPQVGVGSYRIDLGIRHPTNSDRFILGIECDGATYHSARTARDRDLLRQQQLEKLGWRLYRVWSTDWFKDRHGTSDALLRAVERALSFAAEAPAIAASPTVGPGRAMGDVPLHESLPNGPVVTTPVRARRFRSASYVECAPFPLSRTALMDSGLRTELARAVTRVVQAEGPVHREVLLERLKAFSEVKRAGTNILSNLDDAIRSARTGGIGEMEPEFFSASRAPVEYFRTPAAGATRPLHQICSAELRLAVLSTVEDAFSIQREALATSVARLFGLQRLSAERADQIRNIVDALVDEGLLQAAGPNVALT